MINCNPYKFQTPSLSEGNWFTIPELKSPPKVMLQSYLTFSALQHEPFMQEFHTTSLHCPLLGGRLYGNSFILESELLKKHD